MVIFYSTGSITWPVYTNKINEFPMKMSHEIDMAHLVKLLYISWSIRLTQNTATMF